MFRAGDQVKTLVDIQSDGRAPIVVSGTEGVIVKWSDKVSENEAGKIEDCWVVSFDSHYCDVSETEMELVKKYGFYSKRAADAGCGTHFYAKPDGSEVEVTSVYDGDPEGSDYKWEDKKRLGEVSHWLRVGKEPSDFMCKTKLS